MSYVIICIFFFLHVVYAIHKVYYFKKKCSASQRKHATIHIACQPVSCKIISSLIVIFIVWNILTLNYRTQKMCHGGYQTWLSDLANDDPLFNSICSVELSHMEKLLMPWLQLPFNLFRLIAIFSWYTSISVQVMAWCRAYHSAKYLAWPQCTSTILGILVFFQLW